MQPPKQHSWISLMEIKAQLIKKLGLERSTQYFDYLNRFLSLKLSKNEFNKLCLGTVGKDNIQLHNQLIRAVLSNASTVAVEKKKPLDNGVHHQNGSGPVPAPVTSPLSLTNGDILPPSPRKARTPVRERRVSDRKSSLGSNGSMKITPFSSATQQSDVSFVPFFPVGTRGTHTGTHSKHVGALRTDGLLETRTLKEHMEQIITPHGLQTVSIDCANVLNNGLDVYLKHLIRSCVELNKSRPIHEPAQSGSVNHTNHFQPANGFGMGQHQQIQIQKPKRLVSLLDFRVAMELNCKQLGEDWPILLEKICSSTHDFEE